MTTHREAAQKPAGSEGPSRSEVLEAFAVVLRERCTGAEKELADLAEAAGNETKSSAGDKYETAREMFSQARDMQRRILDEARVQLDWIARQDLSATRESAGTGALLRTSEGWMFLCPIPSTIAVGDTTVQGLSIQSPLGQALKGAREGSAVEFRGRRLEILRIL